MLIFGHSHVLRFQNWQPCVKLSFSRPKQSPKCSTWFLLFVLFSLKFMPFSFFTRHNIQWMSCTAIC